MALEAKLAKSAKKHVAKEKSGEKENHVRITSHKGGFLMEKHSHTKGEYDCGPGCGTSVHKSLGSAMKEVRGHLGGGSGESENDGEEG